MNINHARRSRTIYPVALWLNGSEVIRVFWGFFETYTIRGGSPWAEETRAAVIGNIRAALEGATQ